MGQARKDIRWFFFLTAHRRFERELFSLFPFYRMLTVVGVAKNGCPKRGCVIAITGLKRKLLDKIYCDCTAVYLLVRALDKQRALAQEKIIVACAIFLLIKFLCP